MQSVNLRFRNSKLQPRFLLHSNLMIHNVIARAPHLHKHLTLRIPRKHTNNNMLCYWPMTQSLICSSSCFFSSRNHDIPSIIAFNFPHPLCFLQLCYIECFLCQVFFAKNLVSNGCWFIWYEHRNDASKEEYNMLKKKTTPCLHVVQQNTGNIWLNRTIDYFSKLV